MATAIAIVVVVAVLALVVAYYRSDNDCAARAAKITKDDLAVRSDLMRSGKVKPVIDRRYPLREVPEAVGYLETGRARGKVKVIISVQP